MNVWEPHWYQRKWPSISVPSYAMVKTMVICLYHVVSFPIGDGHGSIKSGFFSWPFNQDFLITSRDGQSIFRGPFWWLLEWKCWWFLECSAIIFGMVISEAPIIGIPIWGKFSWGTWLANIRILMYHCGISIVGWTGMTCRCRYHTIAVFNGFVEVGYLVNWDVDHVLVPQEIRQKAGTFPELVELGILTGNPLKPKFLGQKPRLPATSPLNQSISGWLPQSFPNRSVLSICLIYLHIHASMHPCIHASIRPSIHPSEI